MSQTLNVDDPDDVELFEEFARTKQRRLRNQIVERHMGLAAHIAKRYSRAERRDEDLRQVAMIGLVKAADRFDASFGAAFSTFAGQTIEGELKRYFRDASWSVKVPRSAKELHLLVRTAATQLEQRDGGSPSVDDLAKFLDIDRDDVLRGLAASAASSVGTIDGGTDDDDMSSDRRAALADDDRSFEHADNVHVLSKLIADLPERQQEIIQLRFFEEKSQAEIAELVGVSQMHVSRLLKRSFEEMRAVMSDDEIESLGARPPVGSGSLG